MKKIEINSIESVIFFTLYICAQDEIIADEEIAQLAAEVPILQKLYLDIYGELINEDLSLLIRDIAKKLKPREKFIGKHITQIEKDTFSKLLTDPKIQDIALLISRHAASADGFHKDESNKFNYWADAWGL
tara:strand:+ start:401 stop:793 length:393 start_codon:yes stop_codon:yes gene_type:complete